MYCMFITLTNIWGKRSHYKSLCGFPQASITTFLDIVRNISIEDLLDCGMWWLWRSIFLFFFFCFFLFLISLIFTLDFFMEKEMRCISSLNFHYNPFNFNHFKNKKPKLFFIKSNCYVLNNDNKIKKSCDISHKTKDVMINIMIILIMIIMIVFITIIMIAW